MQLLLKGLLKSIECCKLVLMPELSNEQDACKMVLFQIPNMPETICGFGETDDDTKLSIKLHDPHAVHVFNRICSNVVCSWTLRSFGSSFKSPSVTTEFTCTDSRVPSQGSQKGMYLILESTLLTVTIDIALRTKYFSHL